MVFDSSHWAKNTCFFPSFQSHIKILNIIFSREKRISLGIHEDNPETFQELGRDGQRNWCR